jgi:transposase InsO family protein
MITKKAKQRLKILNFWKEYGLKAAKDAFGAKRSTLYGWKKIYYESGQKIESLNPKSQAPINRRKRIIDYRIINEIKRLRTEVCPNMGKEKVKKDLDIFCAINNLNSLSASTIGRIIKEKKIYHHRQKIYHNGTIKTVKRAKKLRKPKGFEAKHKGDLIEIDTIVKYIWGMKRYIITAVDVKTKYAFAWAYKKHNSASAKDFFQKLEIAFPHKIKAIQTDNGSEFHKFFRDYLKEKKTVHYWNYPGQPYRNGHIEKYNRTIQEEFIDWNESLLEDPNEFNEKLMDWLVWYNTKRYHWSLDLQSPVDYMINNNLNLLSKMCWTYTSV